jgi:serine/threonine protein kinase
MNFIPGYEVVELLDESSKSLVYRGWRIKDRLPVILKILNSYSSVEDIARFRLEYEITRSFNLEGVIKAYGLETYNSNLVIVLEDFGGKSLNKLISNQKFSLKESLELAKKIALILGQIHQQKIVHKDINPSNIVFNPVTKQLKLIDFGIASDLSTDDYIITHTHILEGSLAYISPEQTGRMNRHLDYRTDFYSLGITLYQLLCDRLPFTATEPIELLHCHLAKHAITPREINHQIPLVVSNLVMKLLAKNPEERYQSSWGIYKDLEECLQQLETNNTVEDFVLASQDIVEKWQLSQKLYGREKELFFIFNTFKESRKGRQEVILIAGECGIGKTTLSIKCAKQIEEKFDCVVWKSLRDAPPVAEILANLIEFLSEGQETKANLPERAGAGTAVQFPTTRKGNRVRRSHRSDRPNGRRFRSAHRCPPSAVAHSAPSANQPKSS